MRHLRWDDVDLERQRLTIRGELGKSRMERRGRVLPLAPVLVDSMVGWGQREGLVVPGREGRLFRCDQWTRTQRIWTEAGVDKRKWRMPNHCFRHGFVTELKRSGADTEAVEFLVGHSQGVRASYLDPMGLWEAMERAVAMVPEVKATGALRRVGAVQ